MIVFLAFAIVWIIITLVGHLSWITVGAIFRAIFQTGPPAQGAGYSQTRHTLARNPEDDVAAAHRVVSQMAAKLVISPQDARKFRAQIDQFNAPIRKQTGTPIKPSPAELSSAEPPRDIDHLTARHKPRDTGDCDTACPAWDLGRTFPLEVSTPHQ